MKNRFEILIVDSDPLSVQLMEEGLINSPSSYKITSVSTIAGARNSLHSSNFDIILSDWQLPDGEGLNLISLSYKLKIPVVLMHSNGNEQFAVYAIQLGAIDYIAKSSENLSNIHNIVCRALKQWKYYVIRNKAERELLQLNQKLKEQTEKYNLLSDQLEQTKKNLLASELRLNESITSSINREELESILQGITDGIVVIDHHQHITYINQAALAMSGYSSLESINDDISKNQKALNIEIFDELGNPFEAWEEISRNVLKGDISETITIQYQQKNSTFRNWATFRASPGVGLQNNSNFIVFIFHDITAQRKNDAELQKLSTAVEQSPTMVIITDTSGNIEYINPKFTEITGYHLHEIQGLNPRILKSGLNTDDDYQNLWKTLVAGKEWNGEFYNKKKNGTLFWESAIIAPLKDTSGRITHFIGIKEDISHKKQLELELIKAKEEAENSDRLKTAFLANISHEIRTPMNAIMGFSDLLIQPGFSDNKRINFARLIRERASDLLNVINDILDISHLEVHQLSIQETSGSLNVLFDDLYKNFTVKVKDNIKFSFQNNLRIDESTIYSDFTRLKQVLTNLLHNAIKNTTNGSIEFGCSLKNSYTLIFYVKDTGKGIPEDKLTTIFQSFRQVEDNYTTRLVGGTGLGLSIAKGILELMHGTIWVESKITEGASFYFTIPYKPVRQAMLRDVIHSNDTFNWKNKFILIVEDDPSSLTFLTEILETTNVRLINADSGAKALKLFNEHDNIDLVLMDIRMPDINGYSITKEMLKKKPEMTIIAQTAFVTETDRQLCMESGCKDMLAKPYTQKELLEIINRYISINHQ